MIPVLIAVRDIYVARDGSNFTDHNYDLTVPLRRAGLHPDGLTDQAVHYLQTLSDLGGTAGERAVANQMREPGGLAYAEQLLVDRKLITRTANGRSLTVAGRQRLRQHLEEVDP
jgi:Holliday junction resolvasome RuvABC ATP-dependent DNA helicase subunit